MKKIFGLLSMALLVFILGACGNSESEASGESDTKSNSVSQEKETGASEVTDQNTSANMEDQNQNTANGEKTQKSSEEFSIEGPDGTYNVIGAYYNDEMINSEDGSLTLDFDGFKLSFVTFLVDYIPNEENLSIVQNDERYADKGKIKLLMTMASTKNTNDFEVNYAGGITVVTDTNEQISTFDGSLSSVSAETYSSQEEKEDRFFFILEDQESVPDHIEMTFENPGKNDNYFEISHLGERQTIELDYGTAEELSKID